MCTVLMNTSCIAVCDILDIISSQSSFVVSHAPRLHLQFTHTSRCAVPRSTPMSSEGVFFFQCFFLSQEFFFLFFFCAGLCFFLQGVLCVFLLLVLCFFFTLVFVLLFSQGFFFLQGGVFVFSKFFFFTFFFQNFFKKVFSKCFFVVRFFFSGGLFFFFKIFFSKFFLQTKFFSRIFQKKQNYKTKIRRRFPKKILNEGFSVGFLSKTLFCCKKNVGFCYVFVFERWLFFYEFFYKEGFSVKREIF